MATSQQPIQLPIFSIDNYRDPDFPRELVRNDFTHGDCYVVVRNQKIKMPIRIAIMNFLCWKPLFEYGLEPSKSEVFNFKSITTDSLAKVHTVLYERLLDAFPDIDDEFFNQPEPDHEAIPDLTINPEDFKPKGHMKFLMSLANNVQDIENFINEMIPGYWPSIDGLMLAKLCESPDFKDLINASYDINLGTQVVEQQIKANTTELLRRLSNPNTKDNCLYHYMTANALKTNQIGQNIMLFGPRSDIDDSMKKNVVMTSAFRGIQNVNDFATEGLSAKKATYLLKNVTKQSQYFGRKLKLSCSVQQHLHRKSCGSEFIMPYRIPEKYASAFVDKMIIEGNEPIILTKSNINNYVNKEVRMISPFGCYHHDGVCERCAGYGKGRLISYLPLGIHIGIFSAMQIIKRVTQKVLSAKHLIATKSMLYELTGTVLNYMVRKGDKIFWNEKMSNNIDKFSIKIPSDALGPIVDLGFKNIIPAPETFSKISYWYLMKGDEVVDFIPMEQESFFPFISGHFLQFMHDHYNELVLDDEGVIVPLKGYDPNLEMFQYVIINDDMISYTSRVAAFMGTHIENYTDVIKVMDDFSSLVFTKSPDVPFFYLEMVVRDFMITNEKDYTIPSVVDPHHVQFAKLSNIVSESTLAQKLAFEQLKDYLSLAETAIKARPAGIYAPLFGII